MFCPLCWSLLEKGATHCSDCGSVIESSCPQCDAGLAGTMVCCSFCGLDLSYLPHIASAVESIFPSPASFRHPLEVSRFEKVTALPDISFLVHRALEFSDFGSGVKEALVDNFCSKSHSTGAASILAPFSDFSFVGTDECLSPPVMLGGTFSQASFGIHKNKRLLLVDDELDFLSGTFVFSLFGGLFPYVLLAQAVSCGQLDVSTETHNILERWLEAYWYSADRFSALLYKRPSLWLRALLKIYVSKGDLVSLIDVNLQNFPENSGKVASSLKKFPVLVRRLVELSDFVKSSVYQDMSLTVISDLQALSASPIKVSHELSEVTDGEDVEPIYGSSLSQSTKDSSNLVLPPCTKAGASSILYLSSFRNELIMLHPDMSLFQTIKLHELCRHPRNIAAIVEKDLFFISDFETSGIVAIDYKGNHLFDVGESGFVSHPSGMTVDCDFNLWVTDSWNNRLVRFSAQSGYREGKSFLQGKCKRPLDITYDKVRGGFWVCDTGTSTILRLSDDGDILFTFGAEYLSMPDLIRVTPSGSLLISDNMKGSLLSFEATGEYRGNLSKAAFGRVVYIDSMDISVTGEIVISEKGRNRLLSSTDGGKSFRKTIVPAENANESGFPCALLVVPELLRAISKA